MVVIVIVVAFVVVVVAVVAVVVVVVFLLCLVFFFLSALLQKGGSSLDTKVGVCPGWLLGTFPASCPGHALSKQMPCFFWSAFGGSFVGKVCSVFSKGILAVHLQDWPNISQQTCPKFMPLVAVFLVVVLGSVLVLTMPASMRLPPLLHLLPLQNMCP